ncbi:MAG: TetR/AcrR family transcriptional regulator [Calditrichaceae bacterium]
MARINTEERQRQIIDEAIKIIHVKGYSALSIRELAKNVGISEPAIYRHFTNKNEIIYGILDRLMEFGQELEKRLKTISSPKEKIEQITILHMEFLQEHPEMTAVIFSEDIFDPDESIQNKINEIMRNRLKLIGGLIEEAKVEGTIVDVNTDDLSTVILGYLRMVILEWRNSGFKFSIKERGEGLLETLDKIVFREN